MTPRWKAIVMYFMNFFVLAESRDFFADVSSFSVISGNFAL